MSNAKAELIRKNHVTIAGNATSAKTMIFLHGFGTDQTVWREVAAAFADDYRIVLIDNVGSGQSDKQLFDHDKYLRLQGFADDLLAVCAALQIRNATFVGHSGGAMIGVLAALKEPLHFARLVLIGASPRYVNDENYRGGFTKADIDALYQELTRQYSKWAELYASQAMANPQRPRLADEFAASIKSLEKTHALTILCALLQSDHRADVCRCRLPTLLIQAREDVAVPLEVAEYLHRHMPASTLAVIEATGHLPHLSAPAEVIAAMRGFLADGDAA